MDEDDHMTAAQLVKDLADFGYTVTFACAVSPGDAWRDVGEEEFNLCRCYRRVEYRPGVQINGASMKEKRTESRTVVVRLMCEKCDGGEMLPNGSALMSNPPQYLHECNKCGYENTPGGGKQYPRVEYEE